MYEENTYKNINEEDLDNILKKKARLGLKVLMVAAILYVVVLGIASLDYIAWASLFITGKFEILNAISHFILSTEALYIICTIGTGVLMIIGCIIVRYSTVQYGKAFVWLMVDIVINVLWFLIREKIGGLEIIKDIIDIAINLFITYNLIQGTNSLARMNGVYAVVERGELIWKMYMAQIAIDIIGRFLSLITGSADIAMFLCTGASIVIVVVYVMLARYYFVASKTI